MRQKGFAEIIVILATVLLAIGTISYYYLFQKSSVPNQTQNNISPTTALPKETDSNEKWIYNDYTCISYKTLSNWEHVDDLEVDNLPESGINWVKIYKDKNSSMEIARVTIATNGSNFNFKDYKSNYFEGVVPTLVKNKNVYYSNYKYLTETNCPDYYMLIDLSDKNSINTFREIMQDII